MGKSINHRISFSWDIHWSCNYRCPYCWWHGRWQELSKHNYYPGIDKLVHIWERIYSQYGQVQINISGGEPMIYPQFIDFLSRIVQSHTVVINTNLCCEVEAMAKKISNRDAVKINATFHPLFADFDEFVHRASFLEQNNFSVGICYLAWPPQIGALPCYQEKFQRRGFRLSILTFWGKYNGKDYPESYNEDEKAIVSPNLGQRSGEEFQLEPVITEGKLCRAGNVYATVHPDGKALRCGGGSWTREDSALGNIFDDDFRLLEGPTVCTSKYCPCNEWAFLLVKDGE